jgi:hypothetical protein
VERPNKGHERECLIELSISRRRREPRMMHEMMSLELAESVTRSLK